MLRALELYLTALAYRNRGSIPRGLDADADRSGSVGGLALVVGRGLAIVDDVGTVVVGRLVGRTAPGGLWVRQVVHQKGAHVARRVMTARSCFSAAARVLNVPRLRRQLVRMRRYLAFTSSYTP